MFIQEAEGEYRFDSLCSTANPDGCIDAFESGDPSRITYENAAPSNVKEDAAASFAYQINTLYLQDEFPIAQGAVTLVAGAANDQYVYEEFFTPAPQSRVADASLWNIVIGVSYDF